MKLGKLPARKDAVTFKFSDYDTSLATPPGKSNNNRGYIITDNNMFGNDSLGDCVCAEAGHGTLFYNAMANKTVRITTQNVIDMYSAVTGYTPSNPNSDQGTDMSNAASYRRKSGLIDAQGKRHKILAYLDLGVANKDNLKKAIYYFGGAGIGFQFPGYAMDEFNAGQTWHVKSGSIEGGHDVFAYDYDSRYVYVISWGKPIRMTWGFFNKYNDETLVYLTNEMFVNNKSTHGLNIAQLQADLAQL